MIVLFLWNKRILWLCSNYLNCVGKNNRYSQENPIFRDALGDYLAIAKTDKTILYGGSECLKSQHAGYIDDEIYVPLILINCKWRKKNYNNIVLFSLLKLYFIN